MNKHYTLGYEKAASNEKEEIELVTLQGGKQIS
jgi:hypothetical protein